MRPILPILALSILGCAGLFRSFQSIEADIQAHLTTRYGESFVLTRVNGQTMNGSHIPDKYNYGAYPVSDPTLEFRGTADYEARPDKVDDDYACQKVERWLPVLIERKLGPGHRFTTSHVLCASRNTLPPHSKPNEPLPPHVVTLRMQIEAFAEGDPLQVADASRAKAMALTAGMNVHPRGAVMVYPAEILPFVSQWVAPTGIHARSAEDWRALALAVASIDRPERPAMAYPRSAELESEILGILADVRPGAIATSVRARLSDLYAKNKRYEVDVRIADDGLDLATMQAIVKRLPSMKGEAMWQLRGIDRGIDGPQRKRFLCGGIGCSEVQEPLIDPTVVAPRGL